MSFLNKIFTRFNNFLNSTLGQFLYDRNRYNYSVNDYNNHIIYNNGINTHYLKHGEHYGLHYVIVPYED